MDILKAFKEDLPKWCNEKKQPMPKENSNKWYVAWYDFTRTYLKDHYEEIAQDYKNMTLKTTYEIKQPIIEIEEEIPVEKSDWEKVQEYLKKKS